MPQNNQIRIRGRRRKQLDEDKIALAYVLLAKAILNGEAPPPEAPKSKPESDSPETPSA